MPSVLRNLVVAAIATTATPLAAQEVAFAYQDLTAKACRDTNPRPLHLRGDHDVTPYVCPPFAGYGVTFIEQPNFRDLRIDPPGGKSAKPQIHMVIGLGEKMEWRGRKNGDSIVPHAAFVRVRWLGATQKMRSLLTVLKVEKGQVCFAALIDATAHKNANDIARAAADSSVQQFTCGAKPVILGEHTDAAIDTRDSVI